MRPAFTNLKQCFHERLNVDSWKIACTTMKEGVLRLVGEKKDIHIRHHQRKEWRTVFKNEEIGDQKRSFESTYGVQQVNKIKVIDRPNISMK
jgi:hypothetical protein